jgi:hypothetical protein
MSNMGCSMIVKQIYRMALVMAFSGALLYAQDQTSKNDFRPSLEVEKKQQRVSAPDSAPALSGSEKTVAGRLTCAGLATGSYKCAKNQTAWSCTLQCAGTQYHYVLQTSEGQLIPIMGQLKELQRFAADRVVVTGDVTGSGLNARSITKSQN